MIKRFKRFLWDNPKTHRPYKFLWHWKNENLRAAIVFWNEKNANNIQQEPIIKVEKIIKELYITPPILNKVHYADTQKYKIFACAFRIYDEKSGKTGGPGGVLAMQRETMGSLYRDCEIEYLFEPEKLEIPSMLENEIKNLAFMVKKNFYASFFIQTSERIKKSVREGKQPLLLCHDLGSAYGAYLCGYKYVLIYHQQGGLINELEGFHTFLTETDKYIINEMEKVVFTNAEKVYFPSLGAREMFVETSSTGTLFSNDIKYADFAVYNTIKKQTVLESNNIFEKLGILSVDKTTTDVFLSIGDFNENKGMDLVPELLNVLARKTNKKIYWIGIGSKADGSVIERIKNNVWDFEYHIIDKRVDHDTLLSLIEYTDYYIMMQRKSIFDLATLEAMRAGKAIVLSYVGGNKDLNMENNIMYVFDNDYSAATDLIVKNDRKLLGQKNFDVFQKHFSNECFFKNYAKMVDDLLISVNVVLRKESILNTNTFDKMKNIFLGKTLVICGAGSSLDKYQFNKEYMHLALNSALFNSKINFDFLFMQDKPKPSDPDINEYIMYPCEKFFGKISNVNTNSLGIIETDEMRQRKDIHWYELSPVIYDFRVDAFETDINHYCLNDAQSVLFSAIQFAVFAGFKNIYLSGVDFSTCNYGEKPNESKYAKRVEENLLSYKRFLKENYPDINFSFLSTTNEFLQKSFNKIDEGDSK